jgi:hypothetical protein
MKCRYENVHVDADRSFLYSCRRSPAVRVGRSNHRSVMSFVAAKSSLQSADVRSATIPLQLRSRDRRRATSEPWMAAMPARLALQRRPRANQCKFVEIRRNELNPIGSRHRAPRLDHRSQHGAVLVLACRIGGFMRVCRFGRADRNQSATAWVTSGNDTSTRSPAGTGRPTGPPVTRKTANADV